MGRRLRPLLAAPSARAHFDGIERVAQCTFEDVDVPAENLIGEENQGWIIAKYLLTL